MRFALAAVLATFFAFAPARADIAPPYPEFHTGIEITESEPFPAISTVVKRSAADAAGIKTGDRVLALNGSYSKPKAPFYFWLKGLRGPKNSKLQIIVLRNESEVIVYSVPRTLSVR